MEASGKKQKKMKKATEITTFPVPFTLEEIKQNIVNSKNTPFKTSKEELITKAIKYHSQGKIAEAAKYYQYFINKGLEDHIIFSNYGGILQDLGKLKEAESLYRKAIDINPKFAMAYSNLGMVLSELGKLKEAERLFCKAIDINPNLTKAYYSLSLLKYTNNKSWQKQLFSKTFLNNKQKIEKINIYFARANILHKEKEYKESAYYLQLANRIKLDIEKSNSDFLINKSKVLLSESNRKSINQKEEKKPIKYLFIVGMPRSGSTLIDCIISKNPNVYVLGELNILEESFIEWEKNHKGLTLGDFYLNKINNKIKFNTTTDKYLYNYQYAGIISSQINNAKIIHCYRNPLDNILSIYRANFASKGNEYSTSLVDCAKVYLDQDEVMSIYKNRFKSKIYGLNYDLLVRKPEREIKSLISWLEWEWDSSYLSPHLNPHSVSTRSKVEVRSPINSKSIDGWKNYKDMLKPAIEILTKTKKYRNIAS